MPIFLRKSIFWLFVAAFFIIGPSLVLYTAGYRFDLQNGNIIRTGVISLSSTPRNASIYIDDEATQEKTPHVFKQLLPDSYTVRLERDQYLPWSADVRVESGQTADLQNILLFLDSTPTPLFTKTAYGLSVHPDGERLVYLQSQAGWNELWLYSLTSGEHKMINQSVQITDPENVELLWSAEGTTVAIFEPGESLRLFTENGLPTNSPIPNTIERISWHPSVDHLLYFTTSEGLSRYDLETQTVSEIAQTTERSIQLEGGILTFFDNGTYTEIQQLVDDEKSVLALLPRKSYELIMKDEDYLLLQSADGMITLLEIHTQNPILLERPATAFDWHEDSKRLVYSDGSEVNIYEANTNKTTFLTRQSLPIASVLWHPAGRHVLVQDSADIQAYEASPIGEKRHITTLVDDIDITHWWLDKSGEHIYLYGTQNGAYSVFKRQIIRDSINLELSLR